MDKNKHFSIAMQTRKRICIVHPANASAYCLEYETCCRRLFDPRQSKSPGKRRTVSYANPAVDTPVSDVKAGRKIRRTTGRGCIPLERSEATSKPSSLRWKHYHVVGVSVISGCTRAVTA